MHYSSSHSSSPVHFRVVSIIYHRLVLIWYCNRKVHVAVCVYAFTRWKSSCIDLPLPRSTARKFNSCFQHSNTVQSKFACLRQLHNKTLQHFLTSFECFSKILHYGGFQDSGPEQIFRLKFCSQVACVYVYAFLAAISWELYYICFDFDTYDWVLYAS